MAIQLSVVFTEAGTPDYTISEDQNISGRKENELTKAVSNQRYLALFGQFPNGILLADQDLRIIGRTVRLEHPGHRGPARPRRRKEEAPNHREHRQKRF